MIDTVNSSGYLVSREINRPLYENKTNGDVNYGNFLSNYCNVFIDINVHIYWNNMANNMGNRHVKNL